MERIMNEILAEVFRINKIEGYDAFFEFAGHVDAVTVRVHKDYIYGRNIDNDGKQIFCSYFYLEEKGRNENMLTDLKEIK